MRIMLLPLIFMTCAFPYLNAVEKSPAEIVALESNIFKDPKEIITTQLSSISRIIEMTERTKASLSTLFNLITEYKINQESYLEHPDDKELLFFMAKSADQILQKAKNDHLTDVLDEEFLREVNMLAKIYQKLSLPKVR